LSVPDSDSGIYLRGSDRHQVNIWCWPIGSGEMYSVRRDKTMCTQVRVAVTPRVKADNKIGQWNRFEITVRGNVVTVVLNGQTVIASLPPLPIIRREQTRLRSWRIPMVMVSTIGAWHLLTWGGWGGTLLNCRESVHEFSKYTGSN